MILYYLLEDGKTINYDVHINKIKLMTDNNQFDNQNEFDSMDNFNFVIRNIYIQS